MAKRAVLYARVSYDDRVTEGRNLEGQIEDCRAHAIEQGYTVVAELAEDLRGARGADLDLEKLNQILDMAENGEFDVLVAREMDRLSRDAWKQEYIRAGLKKFDCEIEFSLYDFPPTPEGDLQRNMLAAFAEYEAKKIAQRLARGRRGRVKAGNVFVSGRPPYGYRQAEREGKATLEPYEREARIVRLAFTWYTDGDGDRGPLSISEITRRLSGMRVPTYSGSGARSGSRTKGDGCTWVRSVVHQMLKREVYKGIWRYGKDRPGREALTVRVPAIVSPEVWDAAQERLKANRRISRAHKYRYLLGGRIVCGHSGHSVAGSGVWYGGKLYRYYSCVARNNAVAYGKACDLPRYRADYIEGAVWAWLQGWLADPAQLWDGLEEYRNGQGEATAPQEAELAAIDAEVARTQGEIERLIDLYLIGELGKAALLERKHGLEAKLQDQEERRRRLRAALQAKRATQKQIADLREFAERIGHTLDVAKGDYAARAKIVEMLDLGVLLRSVDGVKEVRIVRVGDLEVFILCPVP